MSNKILYNKALQGLTLSPCVFFDKNSTGLLINRFCKDTGAIDNQLLIAYYEAVSTFITVIGIFLLMVVISPYLLIIIPICGVSLYMLCKAYNTTFLQIKNVEMVVKGNLISTYGSVLNGFSTIRALNLQNKFMVEGEERNINYYRSYFALHSFLKFIQLYAEMINLLLMTINVVILLLMREYISSSMAGLSLSMSTLLFNSASLLVKNCIDLQSAMVSAQRLIDYSELPSEGKYEVVPDFKITKGDIKFSDVCLRYSPECQLSLKNLSFEAEGGKKIGIIGRTGAGKSSIVQALFRLVNLESGAICIDGINIMTVGLHDLRKQMSVIPQSPFIFVASIRKNLDPFNEHSDEDIIKALEQVRLKDVVFSCKTGLDTVLGGSEFNLSTGQKQLLCVARIMLRNNKIVFMDEATANIDNETDGIIQDVLANVFVGCTLLVIAHRLRTVIDSDLVLVMEEGQCKEIGKPKELFEEDSLFKQALAWTGKEETDFLYSKMKN